MAGIDNDHIHVVKHVLLHQRIDEVGFPGT